MPPDDCSCGQPMIVRRANKLGVFASCRHCDTACPLGDMCGTCLMAQTGQTT